MLSQMVKLLDKREVLRISRSRGSERYIKRFDRCLRRGTAMRNLFGSCLVSRLCARGPRRPEGNCFGGFALLNFHIADGASTSALSLTSQAANFPFLAPFYAHNILIIGVLVKYSCHYFAPFHHFFSSRFHPFETDVGEPLWAIFLLSTAPTHPTALTGNRRHGAEKCEDGNVPAPDVCNTSCSLSAPGAVSS